MPCLKCLVTVLVFTSTSSAGEIKVILFSFPFDVNLSSTVSGVLQMTGKEMILELATVCVLKWSVGPHLK